jgi:hypothetical protein
MSATIGDVRDDTTAIYEAETALVALLYELSFAAEYGYGSTTEAIESFRSARRHAELAVLAAAIANVLVAAKHEVQSVAADDEAVRMRKRAEGYTDDLIKGLQSAKGLVDRALGHARSLVGLDDSSPAAAIHAKISAQSAEMETCAARVEEIRTQLTGSRDPGELQGAADQFVALRHELEEGSGRAQEIASDSLDYGSRL